ncbi:hypothetical protein CYMTET_3341, partial [Cymbomonas tetramitiformis]
MLLQNSPPPSGDPFAANELKAASVMYDAFRAMRTSPDMQWDIESWEEKLELHVEDTIGNARSTVQNLSGKHSRRVLLLSTKRELYDIVFQGIISFLECSNVPDAAAILEALQDVHNSLFDEFHVVIEKQEKEHQEHVQELHNEKAQTEGEMAELLQAASALEEELTAGALLRRSAPFWGALLP